MTPDSLGSTLQQDIRGVCSVREVATSRVVLMVTVQVCVVWGLCVFMWVFYVFCFVVCFFECTRVRNPYSIGKIVKSSWGYVIYEEGQISLRKPHNLWEVVVLNWN